MAHKAPPAPPDVVELNRPSQERIRECQRLIFQWMREDGTWDRIMQRVRERQAAQAGD